MGASVVGPGGGGGGRGWGGGGGGGVLQRFLYRKEDGVVRETRALCRTYCPLLRSVFGNYVEQHRCSGKILGCATIYLPIIFPLVTFTLLTNPPFPLLHPPSPNTHPTPSPVPRPPSLSPPPPSPSLPPPPPNRTQRTKKSHNRRRPTEQEPVNGQKIPTGARELPAAGVFSQRARRCRRRGRR